MNGHELGTEGETGAGNYCTECGIENVPDEDIHIKGPDSELCYRCCATSGSGCKICNAKARNELISTFEPYSSYLERTKWIKGDLVRAKKAAEKGDTELAKKILAIALKNVSCLNQDLVHEVLEK